MEGQGIGLGESTASSEQDDARGEVTYVVQMERMGRLVGSLAEMEPSRW